MNIMIVGVGGQGTLLASRVLGNTVVSEGYDVKLSEVHGMSQRGGSVVTYVKFGDKVYSPIIDKGEADIILAFELLEAYRALPYLKKGGKIIVNTQEIDPMPVIVGAMEYPKNIAEKIGKKADIIPIDALKFPSVPMTEPCTFRISGACSWFFERSSREACHRITASSGVMFLSLLSILHLPIRVPRFCVLPVPAPCPHRR